MQFDEFYFLSTSICGKGKDDIGEFEINGRIDNGDVIFNKQYIGQHSVLYKGKYDGVSIVGEWSIGEENTGKFKIQRVKSEGKD